MKQTRQPIPRMRATLAFFASTVAAYSQTATTPASSTPTSTEEEAIVLSPFEVSSTQDRGYQATQTLAGTRIRTDLKDVGSAISVVTKEFMQDIGATDNSTLLQYTANAEVAGTRGTFLGQGNATTVDETGNLRAPAGAQRLRGLAAADNTRDFFVSDIPWDSYNVERIDINRGANSFLFGLGSPAGIINASTRTADFRNRGELQFRTGSYGNARTSVDLNQVLFDNVLAIRVDGLWNDKKFEQSQAYENDKRVSASVRFDPQLFNRRDFHTSIKVKFENGDIKANRPRSLPPYDSLTAWFRPDAATPSARTLESGMGKFSVLNGYQIGATGNTFSPWLGGYANQQQPVWFVDGTSNQLYRIYGGYVNSGSLGTNGVPQGASASIVGMRYADLFSDITSLSTYANNARLPNYQYGQYRDRSLTDPTVFDFYNNLIDGPTKSEFEKWNALNIDLSQTLWDDRVGLQFQYDRQKYKRGGESLLGFSPTLNIDLLQNFQDYVVGPTNAANSAVANPNYGRPFVPAGPGRGSSYESDRKFARGTLFGEVRASDFFDPNGFLAKLLGKHRFNGVYGDEKYFAENRSWQQYGNSLAYATFKTQGAPDTIRNLPPVAVVYLGSTLKNASSSANANIPGITSNVTLQSGSIYQFDSTWRPQPGVVYSDPWNVPAGALRDTRPTGSTIANPIPIFGGIPGTDTNGVPYTNQLTQVSNPANYVGWNSNFHDEVLRYDNGRDLSLLNNSDKAERRTKSYAGSWQGYLWNAAIVPTLGWRYDEVTTRGATAQPLSGSINRGALNLNANDPTYPYALPTAPGVLPTNQVYTNTKDHSTAGGVVVHLNKLLGEHDFLPINISLSYNKSSNFTVANVRRDIYGHPIANPSGESKDWGVLLSTKDDKFTFRAVKYETNQTLVNTQLDYSGITGVIKDAMNWRNIKTYYMSGYLWSTGAQPAAAHFAGVRYMWDPAWVDANGRPVASGNLVAGDARIPSTAVHLETQTEADAHRDASLKAINDFQVWLAGKGYFSAWNYGPGPTTQSKLQTRGQYEANPTPPDAASVFDYRGNPDLQGFQITADTASKGYEFEFTANPTANWRVAFNASKTTAVRTNVGGTLLDELVTTMDTLMAGNAGDLTRFNSDWSSGNELRSSWTSWRGKYTLLKLQENSAASELRKWRYNVVTNYSFGHGFLKGVGVGASYRWQDKVIIGYPVIPDPKNPTLGSFDLTKPYYGPSEDATDLWLSYERKLTAKIHWKIQLNVYNVGKNDKLIPISVEPDGKTWAAARIAPVQEWYLTNSFSF